jgi:hypothetical protein
MSRHRLWVHGNTARTQWPGDTTMQAQDARADRTVGGVPWTDIVGLPQGPQMIFRGRDRSRGGFLNLARIVPQPSTYFHFPIPTPALMHGQQAHLTTIFVLWRADPSIALQEVYAFDGPNPIPATFSVPVGGGRDGTGGPADLVAGTTSFAIASQPEIHFGLGISLGFGFGADGNVVFTAAGAEFEIPD